MGLLAVMLGTGDDSRYGSVKVETALGWTPVCDTDWADPAANVVCSELGYVFGSALCCSKLGGQPRSLSFRSVDKVKCSGLEKSLDQCNITTRRRPCSYMTNAAVICYNTSKDKVNMSKLTYVKTIGIDITECHIQMLAFTVNSISLFNYRPLLASCYTCRHPYSYYSLPYFSVLTYCLFRVCKTLDNKQHLDAQFWSLNAIK